MKLAGETANVPAKLGTFASPYVLCDFHRQYLLELGHAVLKQQTLRLPLYPPPILNCVAVIRITVSNQALFDAIPNLTKTNIVAMGQSLEAFLAAAVPEPNALKAYDILDFNVIVSEKAVAQLLPPTCLPCSKLSLIVSTPA